MLRGWRCPEQIQKARMLELHAELYFAQYLINNKDVFISTKCPSKRTVWSPSRSFRFVFHGNVGAFLVLRHAGNPCLVFGF